MARKQKDDEAIGEAGLVAPGSKERMRRIVYRGLAGNLAGIGAVAPGDRLRRPESVALDLVARKGFAFDDEEPATAATE